MKSLPKFITSVSAKLLAVILITGLGINLAIIFFFGAFRHHVAASFDSHLVRYIDYLVKDLGEPPDFHRAAQIAANTNMIIIYESPSRSWTTTAAPQRIPLKETRIVKYPGEGTIRIGSFHGSHVLYIDRGEGRLIFHLPLQNRAEEKLKVLSLSLLAFITLIMIGAYAAMRWVLQPLRWLKQGVDEVAGGRLSYRVPLKRSDELRDLSASFNTMAQRIQQLIRAKEQLVLDVSHELRSPITRIKLALTLIPANKNKQGIQEDLEEMEKKLHELLETARSLAVRPTPNCRPEDLSRLIAHVIERCQARPPAIEYRQPAGSVQAFVDSAQIEKAVANILENALKFSAFQRLPVTVSLAAEPPFAIIRVQDKGIGIPEDEIGFVFEPFYRVDKVRTPGTGGYGLGLSLAKAIIEAHSGVITIQSNPGQGTTMTIRIPLEKSNPAAGGYRSGHRRARTHR